MWYTGRLKTVGRDIENKFVTEIFSNKRVILSFLLHLVRDQNISGNLLEF